MNISELSTPALLIDADALERNLATMAAVLPGSKLRPHVKAHKCTSVARAQRTHGPRSFTCATPREMLGMVAAGLGDDLLDADAMDKLIVASLLVGGEIISAGGTGTYDLHDQVTEIQAGSYAFAPATPMMVGAQVKPTPAHIDPTMAMHDVAWIVSGDEVKDRWPIDLRGW